MKSAMVSLVLLWSCSSTPTARDAWEDVLRGCADGIPSHTVYLGPNNTFGPGSAWRSEGSDYFPRWDLSQAVPSDDGRKAILHIGASTTCTGTSNSTWKASPQLAVASPIAPISVDLSGDLSKSTSVTVTVQSLRIDRIAELPYEQWARSTAAGDFGKDLDPKNRLVMTAAVLVAGFEASYDYPSNAAVTLKAKYEKPQVAANGNLQVAWSADNKLKLTAKEPFYMVGVLSPVLPGRIFGATPSGAAPPLLSNTPEAVPQNATVRRDPTSPFLK